jgi:acetyl esterase/lipase
MKRYGFVGAVALIALFTSGCWPLLEPEGAAPLRYRDEIFTAVTKTADVTYGSAANIAGQTVTLKLDVYSPTGDTTTGRPAMIWVHGGSFSSGTKTSPELVDQANVLAKKGFVNFSISYRLEPDGCSASAPTGNCVTAIVHAMEDAQAAVRFVKANAAAYGIDPNRVGIGGSSAGAITAMNVAYKTGETPAAAVRAGVSLSGANLLGAYDANDAPTFLMHNTTDPLVPYQWALNTEAGAKGAGRYVWLTKWEGTGHVPYGAHRQEILDQTANFLYHAMDLAHAPR